MSKYKIYIYYQGFKEIDFNRIKEQYNYNKDDVNFENHFEKFDTIITNYHLNIINEIILI